MHWLVIGFPALRTPARPRGGADRPATAISSWATKGTVASSSLGGILTDAKSAISSLLFRPLYTWSADNKPGDLAAGIVDIALERRAVLTW